MLNYYGDSVLNAATPQDTVITGIRANHDPSGIPGVTILYNQRPATTAVSARTPWVNRVSRSSPTARRRRATSPATRPATPPRRGRS
ncbi:MAG: hypothetical protein WDM96_05170, partial [Lacunisphaera sp.]